MLTTVFVLSLALFNLGLIGFIFSTAPMASIQVMSAGVVGIIVAMNLL